RPVHHHPHRELTVAIAHLVDDAKRDGRRRLGTDAGARRGAGMTTAEDGRFGGGSVMWRKALSSVFVAFCAVSVLIALVPLFFVVTQGLNSLNVPFFTQMPKPVGELGGGMANAIVGTLIVSGLAALMAVPIGVISGVYMSEYGGTRFASLVRFAADTLNGVPS